MGGVEAIKKGFVTFVSFIVFGSVPIIVYAVLYSAKWDSSIDITYFIALAFTMFTMFLLGLIQGIMSAAKPLFWITSGLKTLGTGAFTAAAAYLLGYLLELLLKVIIC